MGRTGVLVGTIAATLALAAPASAARLVTWETKSRFVNPLTEPFGGPPPGEPARPKALRVNVFLPTGYDGRKRFPVLYLLHGHGAGYDAWSHPGTPANRESGDILATARGFPGLIVMPEGASSWYASWWKGGTRRPAWEGYFLDELVPLVERRLKVRRGRRWRAIAGQSMGGEGAMFLASIRPGYFGSVASFSGSLSIQRPEWPPAMDTQGERFADVFGPTDGFYAGGHNPVAIAGNLRSSRVYVTVGDGVPEPGDDFTGTAIPAELELRQQADDFVAAAEEAGVEVDYRPASGIHRWRYWREALRDAISDWGLFEEVEERPEAWSYTTVARLSEAFGYRFFFPAPPQQLAIFQLDGRVLIAEGAGTVRIRTPGGRRLTATLPFERLLPREPSKRKKRKRAPRRR